MRRARFSRKTQLPIRHYRSRRLWKRCAAPLPYTRRASLLSPGELAFFWALRAAVEPSHWISLKVRLADVVRCPDHLWSSAPGRRLAQKHVDFVLYEHRTTRILAAIELDDSSHEKPDRRRRDQFLEKTMAATNTPLVRIRAARRYDVIKLRRLISAAVNPRVRFAQR